MVPENGGVGDLEFDKELGVFEDCLGLLVSWRRVPRGTYALRIGSCVSIDLISTQNDKIRLFLI